MRVPLVSIIAPVYNAEKYVYKLLDSVLSQDYRAMELIVINDGSNDNSLAILESYKSKFDDKDIKYVVIDQANGGPPNAINAGLRVFTGQYLNFIDCDDYFAAESISKRVKYLEENKQVDVVWSATNVVDEVTGDLIDVWRETRSPARESLFVDMIKHSDYVWPPASKMLRASAYLDVYPDRVILDSVPGQNIQIFLPIYYRGNNVGYIDEPLAIVTARRDSMSRRDMSLEEKRSYELGVRDTFVDTLRKINMTDDERSLYLAIVEDRYKQYEHAKRTYYIQADDQDEISHLYGYDEQKFRDSYMSDIYTADQTQLTAKLVFSSHSLEKSLSNDNFEIGHGFSVAKMLVEMLNIYDSKHYDKSHLAYINTLSVLNAFMERHQQTEYIDEIKNILGEQLLPVEKCDSKIGGSDVIDLEDKVNNDKKNFKDLAEGRFAIRTYANRPVNRDDIVEAVQIAMKTPTVCNRQSIHVHEIYNRDVIEAVLKVQGGIEYYETPPVLLLITADDRGYIAANERNQGFIDGGLFAMSMLYGLEYKKLAACPLNAMFNEMQEKSIRGMLGIPDNEKFITFISVGHFGEDNMVCKSFRYPATYIMSEKTKLYDYDIKTVVSKPTEVTNHQVKDSVILTLRKKIRLRTKLNVLKRRLRVRTRIRQQISSIKQTVRVRSRIRDAKTRLSEMRNSKKYRYAEGATVTLTGYYNYGNILQRYALQKFLQNNGRLFVSYARENLDLNEQESKRYFYTEKFIRRNIARRKFDSSDKLSAYIVGSDQVWRNWGYSDVKSELGYFFFDFLGDHKAKRIAYAASFGQSRLEDAMIDSEFIEYARPLIGKFDSISMRESSGVDIVKATWGVEAVQVLDPTMLLTGDDYNRLIKSTTSKLSTVKPIFTYILASDAVKSEIVSKVSLETSLEVDGLYWEEVVVLPPVEQWLRGFRDAEIVVTDSFHGVVFSILNNTPFIVIENANGGIARIDSLLKQFGIEGRLVSESDAESFQYSDVQPIDWKLVNQKLDELRLRSGKWLMDSLE